MISEHFSGNLIPLAAAGMRERGWHRKLAKRGYKGSQRYQQSLLDHSLLALDVLLALGRLLTRNDALDLSLGELEYGVLAIIVHDAVKAKPEWQSWVASDGSDPSPSHYDETALREEARWFAQRLALTDKEDAISAALRTTPQGRSAAASAIQVLDRLHVSDRWIVVADLVAAIDHCCSTSGVLAAMDTLRTGYLGDKLRFDYHLLMLRGYSTPYIHRATEAAFEAEGWIAVLRFAEGSVYAASRTETARTPTPESVRNQLSRILDEALGLGGGDRAEIVVNKKAATASVFPKPELFDAQHFRRYLEVAATRAGGASLLREGDEPAKRRRKVVEKYHSLVREKSQSGGLPNAVRKAFDDRLSSQSSDTMIDHEAKRIAAAHPEMMILKAFRDATVVRTKEGKIFNPSRFDDTARAPLQAFGERIEQGYDAVLGAGAYDELAGTGTLLQFVEDVLATDRYWTVPASLFERAKQYGDQNVELLRPEVRKQILIDFLAGLLEDALAHLPTKFHPQPVSGGTLASVLSRDLIHPACGERDLNAAQRQATYYVSAKESAKSPTGCHICPLCNDAFGDGRPARADFLDKPEQHTNRAPVLGSGSPIIICEACRTDRVLGQLVSGYRAQLTFVLYPRHNIGREVGQTLVEKARDFMREAGAFMSSTTPDPSKKPTLELTSVLARNLGEELPEGLDGKRFAELFMLRNRPETLREYRRDLERLVRERLGGSLGEWNAACETDYADEDDFLQALCDGRISHWAALDVRAKAFDIRPVFNLIAVTPHLILLPSADPLRGKKEADINARLRQVFIALVLSLGLDVAVAILEDGVPLEPDRLEGVVGVPPNPVLRQLFGGEWIDLVPTTSAGRRRPGAREWLDGLAAAAMLAGETDAFPERSALFSILSAETPGHLVRRIEQSQRRFVSDREMRLIERVSRVLAGWSAELYEAASTRRSPT